MSRDDTNSRAICALFRNLEPLCKAFQSQDDGVGGGSEDEEILTSFIIDVLSESFEDRTDDAEAEEALNRRLGYVDKLVRSENDVRAAILECVAEAVSDAIKSGGLHGKTLDLSVGILAKIPQSVLGDKVDEDIPALLAVRARVASEAPAKEPSLAWLNACIDKLASDCETKAEDAAQLYSCFLDLATRKRAARTAMNKQWLLELMGQSRTMARMRKGSDSGKKGGGFSLMYQLFCLGVYAFSETDAMLTRTPDGDEDRLCILPLSVARLLTLNATWRPLGVQLAEWMIATTADSAAVPEQCEQSMLACFPAFKYAEKYSEATMWSRLVPIK